MNNKNKTRKSFSLKLFLCCLTITVFFSSCEQNSNRYVSLNEKFIEIYKLDIKMKLADVKRSMEINPAKYRKSYYETKGIQSQFDSIYNLIEKDNFDFKPLLNQIFEQSKKHYRYKTAKKLECILNMNTTAIDKKELQSILLELNSTIITEIHYDVGFTDYRFNKISVFVIPEKRDIKLGETYKANVIIGGVDTTALPVITYEDQSKQLKSTYHIIQIKGEKRGKFESKGEMNLISNYDGFVHKFLFKFNYEVK